MVWRACSKGIIYDPDEGIVVYFDPESGRTHLINEVGAWILSELTKNALTAEQLHSLFMSQLENISNQEAQNLLIEQIRELQSFDLIEAI